MKNLILISSLVFISTLTFAQFEKGTKLTSLALRVHTYTADERDLISGFTYESKTQTFELKPRFGYFLSDNFAIGTGITFGIDNYVTKQTVDPAIPDGKSRYLDLSVHLFARKYGHVSDKISVFVESTILAGIEDRIIQEEPLKYPERKFKQTYIGQLGIYPGLTVMLSNKLGVEAGIGSISYSHRFRESSIESRTSNKFDAHFNSFRLAMALHF